MRGIDSTLAARLKQLGQTAAANADPSAVVWISRPRIPLTDSTFLERQLIGNYSGLSRASVALRRLLRGRDADRIYVAYVASGAVRAAYADTSPDMAAHVWLDAGYSAAGTDVAIAFDGTMPKDARGKVQFITEALPWIFRVTASGELFARRLGAPELQLATANCTRVSAVRAMWSEVGGFDFGLVVFFILSGSIYYRQLIAGEWTDAAPIPAAALPAGKTFSDIAAFRTWDYRVGVQVQDSTGVVYEIFTQFMGIGKQNVEHIELKAEAAGKLTAVTYHDAQTDGHLELSVAADGALIYGLSSRPTAAANINNGAGDWGKSVAVTMDYPVSATDGNAGAFVMTDANKVSFTAQTISAGADGKTVTLGFTDFNIAFGAVTLAYTPGTVLSPATAMTAWSIAFTPQHLVPPKIDPPECASAINI
ncbi:MAG: hypothetical protein RR235_08675 [Oscillospiraceae bacterium]